MKNKWRLLITWQAQLSLHIGRYFFTSTKCMAPEFMQYRIPVGLGPSLNT